MRKMVLVGLILAVILLSMCTQQPTGQVTGTSFAEDCYNKYVVNYRKHTNLPVPNPIGVLTCISDAAKDNNDPDVCEQLRDLSNSQIDRIMSATEDGGAAILVCSELAKFDLEGSSECFDLERKNFIESRIDLCKENFQQDIFQSYCKTLGEAMEKNFNTNASVTEEFGELDVSCSLYNTKECKCTSTSRINSNISTTIIIDIETGKIVK